MAKTALLQIGAVGCAAALLAACGSSSPKATSTGSSAPPSTSSSPSPTASSSAATAPASLAALRKIVLQPGDLPAGWNGTPYRADPHDAANNAAMMRCLGVPDTSKDKVAEIHSQDFGLGNSNVSSAAATFKSQKDLDLDIASLRNAKVPTCIDQLMRTQMASSLPAGASIASESFKVTPSPAGVPANVVASVQGTIKVTASGQQFAVYVTIAFITGPLIEAQVDSENLGAPLPASLLNGLVSAVAKRAAQG